MVDTSQISDDKIVYKKYSNGRERKAIWRECDLCGERYKAPLFRLKDDNPKHGKFCSSTCASIDRNNDRSRKLKEQGKRQAQKMSWNENLSYLAGLIASDGSLAKNRPRIQFTNSDKELVDMVIEIFDNHVKRDTTKPTRYTRGGSVWWVYKITSRKLYYFFLNAGIEPAKSKTINSIDVPDKLFADFLRGEIDGDGSFCYCKEKDTISTTINSGSKQFLVFLRGKINKLITNNTQGSINYNNNCYRLNFGLYDTQNIYSSIYGNDCEYYLHRKYNKLRKFFDSFEGSKVRNTPDTDSVGRKLDYQRGLDIIKEYHEENMSMPDLASKYSVDVHTIWDVLHLKHWTTRDLV